MGPVARHEWRVDTEPGRHDRASSQEHIIEDGASRAGTAMDADEPINEDLGKKGGISRTVEFKVFESRTEST